MARGWQISGGVFAGAFIVGAVVLLIGDYPQKLIDSEVNNQLVISLDSPTFDDWVNPPPPIYMQYWLFNVTNPDDVIAGKKPNVTQRGPYTYRLYQPRFNVIFYTNDSVSYQNNHTLVFQRNMSVGPEDDIIFNLNVPLVTVSAMLENLSPTLRGLLRVLIRALGDSDLFPPHTVRELLFGYTDSLLSLAHTLLSLIGKDFPAQFGFFYGYNHSDDGVYLVNSGRKNITHVNLVEKWNHEPHLDYWSTKYGNMLNGTDGTFYHPGMKESETIYAYSTDICRSLPFDFEQTSHVRGLKTIRYHTTAKAFGNLTVNPDNAAFCTPPGNCLDSGVLNISICKQDAPIIISSPHFYMGAEEYIAAVNGMDPSKDEHETFLDIEPTTGTVLRANKRLQLNVYLKSSKFAKQLENVRATIFPFVWLNESVYVDSDSANHLRDVMALKGFVLAVPYVLFGISAILIFSVILYNVRNRKRLKEGPLLTNVDYDTEDYGDTHNHVSS